MKDQVLRNTAGDDLIYRHSHRDSEYAFRGRTNDGSFAAFKAELTEGSEYAKRVKDTTLTRDPYKVIFQLSKRETRSPYMDYLVPDSDLCNYTS